MVAPLGAPGLLTSGVPGAPGFPAPVFPGVAVETSCTVVAAVDDQIEPIMFRF